MTIRTSGRERILRNAFFTKMLGYNLVTTLSSPQQSGVVLTEPTTWISQWGPWGLIGFLLVMTLGWILKILTARLDTIVTINQTIATKNAELITALTQSVSMFSERHAQLQREHDAQLRAFMVLEQAFDSLMRVISEDKQLRRQFEAESMKLQQGMQEQLRRQTDVLASLIDRDSRKV